MIDPKFNNNNHLIEDLKETSPEEENPISKAIQGFTKKSDHQPDPFKKKMMRNLLIIVVVTMAIVLILFIFSSMGGKKSYSDVEDIMIKAATKYYKANENLLPKTTGGVVEVSAKKLANLNYMNDVSRYIKKSSCSGKVVVENNDDNYIYVPYLDCGDIYKTTELYRKITDSKNIITSGDGLYLSNGSYIFRGENVNNYISIKDKLWRIVKVTANNEVVLVLQDRIGYSTSEWDDRYNTDTGYQSGINNFSVSRLHDRLEEIYKDVDGEIFTEDIKNHIVSHNYCIGKRVSNAGGNDNAIECSEVSDSLKVGLLTAADYMYASLDGGCTYTTSSSCQNYNYLTNKKFNWWLLTATPESSYHAYYVTTSGVIKTIYTSSNKVIRPVIYLNSKTMYKSGDGSFEKPYTLK